jgi:hypothetical protein
VTFTVLYGPLIVTINGGNRINGYTSKLDLIVELRDPDTPNYDFG